MIKNGPKPEYRWARVFMALALRAIRRVHYNYGIWNVGACKKVGDVALRNLNHGHGVDLADERTVCAAISQEFLASRFTCALIANPSSNSADFMMFTLERELPKYLTDSRKQVDFFCRKWVPPEGETSSASDVWEVCPHPPAFIEAKRAQRYRPDLLARKVSGPVSQHGSVAKDAIKLFEEKKARTGDKRPSKNESIYAHLLVWGTCTAKSNFKKEPRRFLDKVDSALTSEQSRPNLQPHATRWLPLDWADKTMKVKRALWISLVEVIEPDSCTR